METTDQSFNFQPTPRFKELSVTKDSLEAAYELLKANQKPNDESRQKTIEQYKGFIEKQDDKVKLAFIIAANVHKEHKPRGTGEPFIFHCIEVARIISEVMKISDPDILAAAMVHDTREDHPNLISSQTIQDKLGPKVVYMVEGLTKIKQDSQRTHNRLLITNKNNPGILPIKLADRLHNMSTLDGLKPAKKKEVVDETTKFYIPLAHKHGYNQMAMALEQPVEKATNSLAAKPAGV